VRGIIFYAAALAVAATAPAAHGREPPRHYSAVGAPDPALVAAGVLLGVSIGIEDADDAAIAALYRHQHAVAAILRGAPAARPLALGGAAFEPDAARRGARLGVLRLPEGRAFAVTRAMEDSASMRAARLLLRPLPP
jgi:hypothetical protein